MGSYFTAKPSEDKQSFLFPVYYLLPANSDFSMFRNSTLYNATRDTPIRTSVFITYNPDFEAERTLAIRLHTMGAVNSFTMYLPDRYNTVPVPDMETKARIQASDWLVYFSLQPLHPTVKAEIDYAASVFQNKRRIIIVYSQPAGRNLTGTNYFTEISFSPQKQTVDEVLANILNSIAGTQTAQQRNPQPETSSSLNALLALLSIGAGMMALESLLSSEEPSKTTRSARAAKTASKKASSPATTSTAAKKAKTIGRNAATGKTLSEPKKKTPIKNRKK